MDTGHSIKSWTWLFGANPEERGRESGRENERSLVSLALASIHPFPLNRPGCCATLAQCRALAIARARDLLFHQLVPFLRSAYPIYPLLPRYSDFLRSRPSWAPSIFFLFLFSHCQRLFTSYFALLRIILDHRRRPSRYARVNRIDFRLPRSRRQQYAPRST